MSFVLGLIGLLIGGALTYFFFQNKLNQLQRKLESSEKQLGWADESIENAESLRSQQSIHAQELQNARQQLQSVEASYQGQLRNLEESYELQLQEAEKLQGNPAALADSQDRIRQIEQSYQAQIQELQANHHNEKVAIEQSYQAQIRELQQSYQQSLEELQQTPPVQAFDTSSPTSSETTESGGWQGAAGLAGWATSNFLDREEEETPVIQESPVIEEISEESVAESPFEVSEETPVENWADQPLVEEVATESEMMGWTEPAPAIEEPVAEFPFEISEETTAENWADQPLAEEVAIDSEMMGWIEPAPAVEEAREEPVTKSPFEIPDEPPEDNWADASLGEDILDGADLSSWNENWVDAPLEEAIFAEPDLADGVTSSFLTRASDPQSEIAESKSTSQSSFISRYPNLDCPDKVLLGQRFSLTVEFVIKKPENQPNIQPLMILKKVDTQVDILPEVEVVLSASGFDIEGSNTQIVQIEQDDDSSVRFVLVPSKLGQHKIKVLFYQNGKPIGKAVRNILVSEQIVAAEVLQPNEPSELAFKTLLTIPPQDLELLIDLDKENKTLSFSLHSVKEEIDYHRKKCGKVILQGSPLDKMQVVYKEMTQLAQKTPTMSDEKEWAERRLASLGNELWDELIPQELKNEYWKFKSRVKSVLITSEEPWIPWEMLKPYRFNDDGEKENDLFWCQKFAVSRWLSGAGTADDLNIKTVRPIAPTQSNLPSVMDEIDFMERMSGLRSSVTPLASFSTRTQVLDSLENEDLSILHFACHGMFDSTSPNNSAIALSGGALCPSDIKVRFIGKRPRPLIFINACHGGRTEFSFTGLGGWAECFVNARAGAFIGAMWEVSDKLALQFAKTFYTAFLRDNQSIAEAFRQAREDIRQAAPYNSTWLAYTLYADPEGKVKT